MFTERDNALYAGEIRLSDLARRYSTPLYVYDAAEIRAQYDKLTAAMEKTLPADRQPMLCYAAKANDHIAVLSYIRKCGGSVEIVSEGELYRALRAGFAPAQIVSTGVGKSCAEITALLNARVYQINVESLEELHRIQDIAQRLNTMADIVLRFNPDVSGGGHDKISTGRKHDKFGLSETHIYDGFALAADMSHIKLHGLSMHIGSQVFQVTAFEKAFQKLPTIVQKLRAQGHTITRLDIGGGFPIQYDEEPLLDLEAYARWVNDIIVPLDTTLIMEPGRFLVGNAAVLLAEVEYIKTTKDNALKFLILNTGMNDLVRPAMYEAYHKIEPVENGNAPRATYDIVGPICESSDKFATARKLPQVRQGDIVAIRSAGAYGMTMANNYNTRRRPAIVFVNGDQHSLISARETYDALMDGDKVPDWV
jgi:diaminopimelate decarboxylase